MSLLRDSLRVRLVDGVGMTEQAQLMQPPDSPHRLETIDQSRRRSTARSMAAERDVTPSLV
jgi:hypothetical protein